MPPRILAGKSWMALCIRGFAGTSTNCGGHGPYRTARRDGFNGQQTYSSLDLFNYNRAFWIFPETAAISQPTTERLISAVSTTPLYYPDDIADWAAASSLYQAGTAGLVSGDQDSFNAFDWKGVNGNLSQSDVLVSAALRTGCLHWRRS